MSCVESDLVFTPEILPIIINEEVPLVFNVDAKSKIEVREVVGDDDLEQAYRLVALGYSRLGREPLNQQGVYAELCSGDALNRMPLTKTFLAKSTADANRGEPLGTLRLAAIGLDPFPNTKTHIEALELFRTRNSVAWEQVFGVNPRLIGEVGRFSLAEGLTQETKEKATELLVKSCVRKSQMYGLAGVVAVMPKYVRQLTEDAGLQPELITEMVLDVTSPLYLTYQPKYPRYWHRFNDIRCYWMDKPSKS